MSITLPIMDMPSPEAMQTPLTPAPAPSAARREGRLFDRHGRVIRDLRLSITDRCNFRCVYCMDPDYRYMPKRELLSLEEYLTVARVCAGLGLDKLRITGGEPTLYGKIDEVISAVGKLSYQDVALTTNGSRLDRMPLKKWRHLGLHRITLSLDSMRAERVAAITRTAQSSQGVIQAIDLAKQAGFDPIKVNAVIVRGVNDDEVADFADFARDHDVNMRLIEFMPLDSEHAWSRGRVFSASEMLELIRMRHDLIPMKNDDAHSTSMNFQFSDGAPGSIGVIASVTRPFCGACSRLRITADGKIRPCLFSHEEWDLRPMLRSGASDEDLAQFITNAVWTKQAGHGIGQDGFTPPERSMSAIGG